MIQAKEKAWLLADFWMQRFISSVNSRQLISAYKDTQMITLCQQ